MRRLTLAWGVALAACGAEDGTLEVMETSSLTVEGLPMTMRRIQQTVEDPASPTDSMTWRVVSGGDGEGPPILFIHGAPECWYTWHRQLGSLGSTRPVIAIDLPGFGVDGDPLLPEGSFEIRRLGDRLVELMAGLGHDTFDLVAHDWGAALGTQIAGAHPDRVRRFVRAQAPIETYDPANTPWWTTMSDPVAGPQAVETFETVDPVAAIPPEDVLTPSDRAGYETHCLTENRFEAWRRYFVDTAYEPMMARMPELAAAIEAPVMLLQADADPGQPLSYFGPSDLAWFRDATFRLVADSGHFTHIEQSAQVTEAIQDHLD